MILPGRFMVRRILACLVAAAAVSAAAGDGGERSWAMRVETELFLQGSSTPAVRSLTLFRDGVAWDFLEVPTADEDEMQVVEIALHDPARERVVVIDPVRNVKTQVDGVRLERLGVSLAKWARGADDRLIRWAGGPDFDSGLTEGREALELSGPRVRYAVKHAPAPAPEAAAAYRQFADSALMLKALLHPGGIPPFPRLAINRRLEDADAIPTEVILEMNPRLAPLGGLTDRRRSVHKMHPRLLETDLERIEEAEAQAAAAEAVPLAAFVDRGAADSRTARNDAGSR